jgi:hypothetical protein
MLKEMPSNLGWDLPVLDLLRHSQEGLLDIRCILRRCLQEGNAQLVGKFLHGKQVDVNINHGRNQLHKLAFATLYSTTFLLVKSDLLPTSNLFTPSDAYLSIS